MEELLRLDSSRMYENHHRGCIWSLFHAFNFNQRRERKKMLSFQRLADSNYDLGSNTLIVNDETEGKDTDKEANLQDLVTSSYISMGENKPNNMRKISGKAGIIHFIARKLSRRQNHKGKVSHSSSQLKRITSVHHLGCDDFGPPGEFGEKTSDSETSTMTLSLDGADPAAISEHESAVINGCHGSFDRKQEAYWALDAFDDISHTSQWFDKIGNHLLDEHKIIKAKLIEARDALLKQKDTDPKGMTREFSFRSKIFLDTLHLFNNNREALFKLCKSQNSFLANDMKVAECHTEARVLNKSLSIAGLELPGNVTRIAISSCKQMDSDSFVNQGPKSESSFAKTAGIVSDIEFLPGFDELREQRETVSVLSHLRSLKHRMKYIFEDKKGSQRISRDGILHKVPFGHKLLEDKEVEKLYLRDGPVSEKYFRGAQGFKFDSGAPDSSNIRFSYSSFQRSRSISDSLERYCQLMDSISANHRRTAPVRSNSVREGTDLQQGKRPNIYERMLSNPEIRSYAFSEDVQKEIHLAFQDPKKPISKPVGCEMVVAADGSYKLNNVQPVVEKNSCEEGLAFEFNKVAIADEAIVPDKFVVPLLETRITEAQEHEGQLSSVNEYLQDETFHFSEVDEKYDLFNEHVTRTIGETNIKPEKASPISILDSIVEEPVSPVNFIDSEGLELQLSCIDLNERQPHSEALNDKDSDGRNVVELPNLGCNEGTMTSGGLGANSLLAHFDHKNEARFNYVKHILSKSGYGILLRETDVSSYEVDAARQIFPDPFEVQHLCDLLNEVIFQIYEYSTAPSSWLQRFHSKIRSMPTGRPLLEEAWTEIRWHLHSPPPLGAALDDLMTRDFTKNDGWMNLYRDAECFGLLLEQLILDDLLDEIIVDCDGL